MKISRYTLPALASLFLFSAPAFADCELDVGTDAWNELSVQMNEAYTSERYEDALQSALALEQMCGTPPTLLFIISDSYQHLGNEAKSAEYIKRASLNLNKYELPQQFVEQVWFRRAELELPLHEQIVTAEQENQKLKAQLEETKNSYSNKNNEQVSDSISALKAVMWSGTGTAIAGAGLGIAGAVLIGSNYHRDIACNSETGECYVPDKKTSDDLSDDYVKEKTGIALLSVGATLAVVGTVAALVAHFKIVDLESAGNDVSINLNAGFGNVGMSMTF